MKLLHIMASVNPEAGGPIEALVQSDPVWRRLGHSRTIVSLDNPGDPWVTTCPIRTVPLGSPAMRQWRKRLPLLRYGFTPHLVPWLRANVGKYDTIVVNGLWNYAALAARRVLPGQRVPYVVFTHGMLDPWFRTAYPAKHAAKQLVWWLSEGPLLRGARAVLFTSEKERRRARHAFWPYRLTEGVSPYGTGDAPVATLGQAAAFRAHVPELADGPFLLFLSRLHPKKGCDLLLHAFAAVFPRASDPHLVMAGPDPDGWMADLKALAASLGLESRVHWPGMLRGEAKGGRFTPVTSSSCHRMARISALPSLKPWRAESLS